MPTPEDCIANYIRAKDENRSFLMARAFAGDAVLDMVVKTDAISFPPRSSGLESITDTLVRRFGATFENVHTFCLAQWPPTDQARYSCGWLVGMSEKGSRRVRAGCGRYDWRFRPGESPLVERLTITVEVMQSLPPSLLNPVMDWLAELPYPWCDARVALARAPALDERQPLLQYMDGITGSKGGQQAEPAS